MEVILVIVIAATSSGSDVCYIVARLAACLIVNPTSISARPMLMEGLVPASPGESSFMVVGRVTANVMVVFGIAPHVEPTTRLPLTGQTNQLFRTNPMRYNMLLIVVFVIESIMGLVIYFRNGI